MIIMKTDATEEEITAVINEITRFGLKAAISRGDFRTVIGLVGDERKIDFEHFNAQSGVKEAFAVEAQYKLINWEYNKHFKNKEQRFVIKTGNLEIGGDVPVYIAGPCAVESKDQLFEIAEGVKKAFDEFFLDKPEVVIELMGTQCAVVCTERSEMVKTT